MQKYKAESWSELTDGNYSTIKAQLANGNPVFIGISVYPNFDKLDASNPIYNQVYGTSRGAHALCVIGYDDTKRAVKTINSWGTDW